MKIEEQVCSLGLAKQLKELGVKQKSYWCWKKMKSNKARNEYFLSSWDMENRDLHAYTVAELGEMLPPFASTSKIAGIPSLGWRCIFHIPPSKAHYEEEDIEADARAKMLIYLIENKLMKMAETE